MASEGGTSEVKDFFFIYILIYLLREKIYHGTHSVEKQKLSGEAPAAAAAAAAAAEVLSVFVKAL